MVAMKENFSSQADPELLVAMREIAEDEGREFQCVLEDAMRAFVESHAEARPRAYVMKHFRASVEKNRRLGELLAQ